MSQEAVNDMAMQLAGQLLMEDEALYQYLGENFIEAMGDGVYQAVVEAVANIGAAILREHTGKHFTITTPELLVMEIRKHKK